MLYHLYRQHTGMNVIPLIYLIQFLPMLLNTHLYPTYKFVYLHTHINSHILSLSPNAARITDKMVCRPTTFCFYYYLPIYLGTLTQWFADSLLTVILHIHYILHPMWTHYYSTYPGKYRTTAYIPEVQPLRCASSHNCRLAADGTPRPT